MDKEEYDKKKGVEFTGVTIVFICHDGNGKILMAKRSKNCRDEQGNWDIGAGSLEFGHKIEDTLKREIKEEYCTDVLGHEFLGFRDVHRNNNGINTHWISLDFKVHVDRKQTKIGEPEKIDEIGWFQKDQFPTPLHSQLPKFLEKYKDKV
jgi:ADP-ribose pyrophosphatase YjhB (NUDIX family)